MVAHVEPLGLLGLLQGLVHIVPRFRVEGLGFSVY